MDITDNSQRKEVSLKNKGTDYSRILGLKQCQPQPLPASLRRYNVLTSKNHHLSPSRTTAAPCRNARTAPALLLSLLPFGRSSGSLCTSRRSLYCMLLVAVGHHVAWCGTERYHHPLYMILTELRAPLLHMYTKVTTAHAWTQVTSVLSPVTALPCHS